MGADGKRELPRHVGIIMDGNGRWARARSMPRVAGHQQGAKAVRRTVTACRERGIEVLTLFAFSSQNWSRPTAEVQALMALLAQYIRSERRTLLDNGIRLTAIGDIATLPDGPRAALEDLMDETAVQTEMTLCLALSYGGQEEIVAATRELAGRVARGELAPEAIDAERFAGALWSAPLGPVDLMIRTSGELRISNFLLWQLAYSELFFTEKMWPEFDEPTLDQALEAFAARDRRYGKIG